MNDMTSVITPKSDQINSDDLIAGPMTVTIQGVAIKGGEEQPVSIDIGIPGKVYRPCKSMSRILVAAWGPDAKAYTGRSLTLYRDPTVKWGGLDVGGIRISHMSHLDKDMTVALTATRANRKPFTVRPMPKGQEQTKASTTPSTPQQSTTETIDDALKDWADIIDSEVDLIEDGAGIATFNSTMKSENWDRLKHADPERASAIKKKVSTIATRLKEGTT